MSIAEQQPETIRLSSRPPMLASNVGVCNLCLRSPYSKVLRDKEVRPDQDYLVWEITFGNMCIRFCRPCLRQTILHLVRRVRTPLLDDEHSATLFTETEPE